MYDPFSIGDVVEQNHCSAYLLRVSGVIHKEERLFVTDDSDRLNDGREFEVHFSEITKHWQEYDARGFNF